MILDLNWLLQEYQAAVELAEKGHVGMAAARLIDAASRLQREAPLTNRPPADKAIPMKPLNEAIQERRARNAKRITARVT